MPPSPRTVDLLALTALGLLLAAAGVAPGVDSIVWYVFAIVDGVPDTVGGVLRPIYNPPPMYTHAYRPLSTALVKLGSAAFGRTADGLMAQGFAHGALLVGYGVAARSALVALGHGRLSALGGAALAMLTPSILFSAWTLPEFDFLGGAFVLASVGPLRRMRLAAAAPWLALALLTKETAAVFALAWLLAWASVATTSRERRPVLVLAAFAIALLAAVAPILLVTPPVTHSFSVADPGFTPGRAALLAFHDAVQLQVSLGAAGSALVLWRWLGRRRRVPGVALLGITLCVALFAPVVHRYNHYESIVLSDWPWVLACVVALLAGLGGLAATGSDDDRLQGRLVWLGVLGLLAGPVLTGFSRADLSARLFAPVLPVVFGLGLQGAEAGWRRGGLARVGAGALAACLVWTPLAGAVNAWQSHQARFAVERGAKVDLAAALRGCPVIIETNRDQEIAMEELARLGADPTALGCTQILQLAHVDTGPGALLDDPRALEGFDQTRAPASAEGLAEELRAGAPSRPVHLYVQGPRASFSLPDPADPHRSLSWAESRMPDVRPGNTEQAVGMAYVQDTPLERFFAARVQPQRDEAATYFQVPPALESLPRRLWEGWPVVERWSWRARRWSL